MKQISCKSWTEFKTVLSNEIYSGGGAHRGCFLFRGHGSAEWSLAPSFDRAFIDFEGEDRDRLEDELLRCFRQECEADSKYKDLLNSEIATLSLAQHYGLPTRLLDWTESPYIATFFAFQGHFQDSMFGRRLGKTVAIWVLDPKSYVWSDRRGVQLVAPATWDNERLRKQAGWFTWSRTPFRDLVDYVGQFKDAEDALKVITLPSSEAAMAIPDLDLMGINHANLFADLEARARSSVTRALLRIGKPQKSPT
jgi:hypothetical protein